MALDHLYFPAFYIVLLHLRCAKSVQAHPADVTSAAGHLQAALADEVMQEVGQAALQVSAVANDDFKVRDHGAAIPNAVVRLSHQGSKPPNKRRLPNAPPGRGDTAEGTEAVVDSGSAETTHVWD